MYVPEDCYNTIREAQLVILKEILDNGKKIEETLEINNISICIRLPLKDTYKIFENVTPVAAKHMDQMILKSIPNLDKTHYERLHNWKERKYQSECIKEFKQLSPISDQIVMMHYDQIKEVIKRLKENPFSKRAVLTLWSPEDVNDEYAMPWVSSQLMIRENKLIMTNFFRSLDIWNGFPYNCVGIANLQADIADRIGVETGEFIIHIGSAHTYKKHINEIKEYLAKT